jgi:branched-chain amino acid transport system permease protein
MLIGQVLNGLVNGAMYSLVALGFTLIIGVLDKLNFTHPEVFMFGGFAGIISITYLPMPLAFFLSFLIGGCLGLFTEWIAFRRFQSGESKITAALSSMALGLIFTDCVQKYWGTEPVSLPTIPSWMEQNVQIVGVTFPYLNFAILGVTFLLMFTLHALIFRTHMGRQIRAVAESPSNSSLLGVDVKRVSQVVFFISSGLAAEAGFLLSLRSASANSEIGLTFGLKALAIMAIGGLGDMRGAMLVGLLIGVIEACLFVIGMGRWVEMTVWVLVILTMVIKPNGLFASRIKMLEARA